MGSGEEGRRKGVLAILKILPNLNVAENLMQRNSMEHSVILDKL